MRENLPRRNHRLPEVTHPGETPAIEYVLTPESEEPRFRDYWKMLLKRRRLIIFTFVTVFILGVLVTSRTTPLYTASTTLRIEPQNTPVIGLGGSGEALVAAENYFETQVALLRSRALAARVIKDLGLEHNPSFTIPPQPLDQVQYWVVGSIESLFTRISGLLKAAPEQHTVSPSSGRSESGIRSGSISRYLHFLSVEPMPKTQLVKVSFSTIDPAFSEELANAHAAAFIRMNLETRFELTKEAREFLEKKLTELKVKVGQSEEALNRFRKAHGVVSLEGNENIIVDRLVDLNRRLTEARDKRIELESLVRTVKDTNFTYLSQIIDNNLIVQLRGSIEALEAERARLSTVYKADHPRIQELGKQVRQAQQRLNLEIRKVVRSIESDYAAARANEAALQADADRQQKEALNLKELAVQHTLLQGEFEANRTIFANVLSRLNEASVSTNSPISNMQITEPAEMPRYPSSPQTQRSLMLASAFGLSLGVGLALVLEHLNSSVRTPEEVWRAVAIPTLGAIPHWRSLRRREYGYKRLPGNSPLRFLANSELDEGEALSNTLVASHHPFSLIAESYRMIRSGLLLTQSDQPVRVILLTSSRPSEGKTSVTLNLAITLAQSGRQVVVVDADLRAGNCHALLGISHRYGLVHLLNDDLPLDAVLHRTSVEGLYLIPRGPVPPDPAKLLGSDRMKETLEALRARFDLVLIDTPPAIAVSDALVLSVQCDGVLLVLRAQKTPAAAVQRVVERLEAVGAHFLGTVLVGADMRHPDYAEYRHYYKSYYSSAHKGTKKQS
jgi:capsular exopolysaccharide synthesis family protein